MAIPERRDELNQVDEQTTLKRLDEQNCQPVNQSRIDEHHRAEDRDFRAQRDRQEERRAHGDIFAQGIHPERYPRESLSRLEEGILEDDELRHADDHLGVTGPDLEQRIMNGRNLARVFAVCGACLWVFSWVLLLWVGWDVRSGKQFFLTYCLTAFMIGAALFVAGYVQRFRVMRLLHTMPTIARGEKNEGIGSEHRFAEGDRAA